ncbi:MAG: hypothetical protein IT486_04945 [Gammaproteobacteria bacterium]|nr:hypothetical protein [Gammaproteobacteria bacterium]
MPTPDIPGIPPRPPDEPPPVEPPPLDPPDEPPGLPPPEEPELPPGMLTDGPLDPPELMLVLLQPASAVAIATASARPAG